jgi:cytochrome c
MTLGRIPTLLCVVITAASLCGCDAEEQSVDSDFTRPSDFSFQRGSRSALIDEGHTTYKQYCIGCHGETGDGMGDAAPFLNPLPRNFVQAKFKFSSTRSGQLPTDDDLAGTIRNGLKGSAMPSFEFFDARRIDGLIAYIKTFSPEWERRAPAPQIPRVDDPWRRLTDHSEAVARGRVVYHGYTRCWSCHPSYESNEEINRDIEFYGGAPMIGFRPDIRLSEGKPNTDGDIVYPPDFHRDFIRAGASIDELYRSISAGITGTAMPTWIDSMDLAGAAEGDPPRSSPRDLWALAYYVQHLIKERPPRVDPDQVSVRDQPRPIWLGRDGPPRVVAEEDEEAPVEFFD